MSNLVAKFTQSEIYAAVAAVSLPAALQGISEWSGSASVGGNTASHLASVNGKSQSIGLCQCFADWWFGSESLPNILKGIKNTKVRRAFDSACADVVRNSRRPISADDMLAFLRGFTAAALGAEQIDADKFLSDKADSKPTDSKPTDTNKPAAVVPTVEAQQAQAELLEAQAGTIASLQAEVEALRQTLNEQRMAIVAARTLKEVKQLVA